MSLTSQINLEKTKKKDPNYRWINNSIKLYINHIFRFFYSLNFFTHLNLSILDWYTSFVIIPILFYLLGLYDDRFNLRPSIKILLSLILFYVVINLDNNFLLSTINIPSFNLNISILKYSIFITLLCFLLFQHAFNMFDGINLHIGSYSIIFSIFLFYITNLNIFILIILPFVFFLLLNFKK